jgi:hypothetical protein
MSVTEADLESRLRAFIGEAKFRCSEPEFRILNPSPPGVTVPLELAFNKCALDLIGATRAGASPSDLKAILLASLAAIDKPFDTEDREYVCYYYDRLARIIGIKVAHSLNVWLYGWPLGTLVSLRASV